MKILAGVALTLLALSANAAVIHTYEFGNTANGGLDSGILKFSSEGVPVTGGWIESDYGDLKATINGNYYDFNNLDPLGGGWTQTSLRYLYDFTSPNNQVRVIADFEKGTNTFQYNLILSNFDEPTGFGIGSIWLRTGTSLTQIENYSASVGYLHTTSPIPIPAAVWLFGSGLIGLIGLARRQA